MTNNDVPRTLRFPSGKSGPRLSSRRLRYLLLTVIVLLLGALVGVPFLFGRRTDLARERRSEVVTPAREALLTIQFELAAQVAAVRGYQITGDPDFLVELEEAIEIDRAAADTLDALASRMDSAVVRAVQDLETKKATWAEVPLALIQPGDPPAALIDTLIGQDRLESAQEAAGVVRAELNRTTEELNASIASNIRLERMLTVLLSLAAISIAFLVAWLSHRVDRLSDQLRIRAAEEAARQRREREERDQLLQRERAAHGEAETALEMRDRVLRVVSHDLKNPLHTIEMAAGVLEIPLDEQEKRKQIEIIQRTVVRANRLVTDLLDSVRLESGRPLALDRERLDVESLVFEALEGARFQAGEKGQDLVDRLDPEAGVVLGDRDRLIQVLSNLLSNAVKFTPEGGRIVLRVAPAEAGLVRFSVTDSGPGIPEDEIPHLFEPFAQAEASATLGTGLGLSIVQGIVNAHGGTVLVESPPGEGATFSFTIPGADVDPEERELGADVEDEAPSRSTS